MKRECHVQVEDHALKIRDKTKKICWKNTLLMRIINTTTIITPLLKS